MDTDEQPKLEPIPLYIQQQLLGAFPTSKLPTDYNCIDISRFMAANNFGIGEFDQALIDYRERNKKGEFCPAPKTLKQYFPKKYDLNARYDFFIGCVIRDGWDRAIWENEWANDMLIKMDFSPAMEYSSLDTWQIEFCNILHKDGDPAKAYLYAAENAMPAESRWWYKQKADYLVKGSIEEQQGYFSYFRFQRPKDLALYGRKPKGDIVDAQFYPTQKALSEPTDDAVPF